ncbi:MAG: hypothetical protein KDB52_08860 [Solirubrobacterales bacterium]|nr:hypothetical protein [Solirubrobacterales bacterium]
MTLAVLLAFALLLAPGRAEAADEPFKIDFDQSAMQFGLLSDLPLGELASTGSLEGTIDEAGNVTIPKGKFVLPEVGITDPIAVKIFMGVESDATGTFNRETGELVLNAKAGVWVSVDLEALLGMLGTLGVEIPGGSGIIDTVLGSVKELTCGFSPMDVTFTTGETSLGSGQPFTAGPLGPGALTAEWSQLGPFAGKTKILGLIDACQAIKMYAPQLLEGALGGVLPEGTDLGGLDIEALLDNLDNVNLGPSSLTLTRSVDENPIVEPPLGEPNLSLSVNPKKRKVKAGRKATFTVKVKNSGEAPAKGVKLCLKLNGPATTKGKRCRTLGVVMTGATQTRRFTVKAAKGKKKKSASVKFELQASNATRSSSAAKLLIRR